jgi:CrcB protein
MQKDDKRAAIAMARLYLAVGCGAALGSLLRFLCAVVIVSMLGQALFLATGFVNVVGSFVITFFATVTGPHGRIAVGPVSRQFVMAGICGGFTTFSAMSLDTFMMLLDGDEVFAAAYLVSVLGLSLLAAWIGYIVAGRLNQPRP